MENTEQDLHQTADLLIEYRNYAAEKTSSGEDFQTFSEWKTSRESVFLPIAYFQGETTSIESETV